MAFKDLKMLILEIIGLSLVYEVYNYILDIP